MKSAEATTASAEQTRQELQYQYPYHWIPRRAGARIIYSQSVDWASEYLKSIEVVAGVVAELRPGLVADVGCGDGRIVNDVALLHPNTRWVGIDYSARAIALAQALCAAPNASFLSGSVGPTFRLPEPCDLVTLVEVLEHIPPAELAAFIRHAFALLRPGGTMLVTVPHVNRPVQRKHFQHFTGASLHAALMEAVAAETAECSLQFIDEVPGFWQRGIARLARNRVFTIEPWFQCELHRRAVLTFVPETRCGRIVARIGRK